MNDLLNKINRVYDLLEKIEQMLFSMKCEIEELEDINLDEYISNEGIKETIIKSIHDHEYEFDINCENNITYADEPEKREAYYIGVNSGYNTAFFWFCEYLGLLNFFENEIAPIFEKHRLKLIEEKQ